MAKLYTEHLSNSEQLKPREETIKFLLDYSKAFTVISYGAIHFEAFKN